MVGPTPIMCLRWLQQVIFWFSYRWVDSRRRGAPFEPVLSQAKTWGMELKPTARDHYRALTQASAIHESVVQSGELILPEGGRGSLAMQG